MGLEEVKQTFLIESRGLLDAMEHALLDLEENFKDEENLNAIFRAAHTIKGSGGMFGYTGIVEFTHIVENFLDKVRKGNIDLNAELTSHLLKCHDHISSLVELYVEEDDPDIPQELNDEGIELMDFLSEHLKESAPEAEEKKSDDLENDTSVAVGNSHWHISLRIKEDVFRHGLDPLSFINYLDEIGTVVNLITIVDHIPDLEELNAESCYLGFELEYDSDKDKETIEQVFEFLLDDCLLSIIPPNAGIAAYEKMFRSLPESPERLQEIFSEMKILKAEELSQLTGLDVPEVQEEENTTEGQTGKETETQGEDDMKKENLEMEKTKSDSASLPVKDKKKVEKKQESATKFQSVVQRYIRIDANKLDTLINQVGELVITSANVRQLSEQSGNKDLTEASSMMNRLVEDIRDISMNIRMVQIGETFRKFERVVHDLSREMGKKINLRILGGETELDKTVVEKISDPLIHLIRNAVDHGIASPSERKSAGKPETGTITLNAHHDTGNIVIEVTDDGDGLNVEKILAKAIETGIVSDGHNLPEKEIFSFIFQAGFSTATKITNVSGRGVGMDVVRRNVESLRGSIDVDSEKGKGTTIRIYLPLTLAIIDGFLARVGKSAYVLPLDMVLECIDLSEEYRISREGGNFINLRGEVLPFLNLREFFNMEDLTEKEQGEENQSIIVVNYARQKAGLVVDELFGEFQTVIKPLGKIFRNLQGISGATILGNGEVALILDVPRLINSASKIKRKEKVDQFDLKED